MGIDCEFCGIILELGDECADFDGAIICGHCAEFLNASRSEPLEISPLS